MPIRSRGYSVTINNWTIDDFEALVTEYFQRGSYLVMGFEYGSKNGVYHIQGYIHYTDAVYLSSLKNRLPRAHIEVAVAEGNKTNHRWLYCMKDNDYIEFGIPPKPIGKSKNAVRMIDVYDYIKSGANLDAVKKQYPSVFYMHKEKIVQMYNDILPKKNTSFYAYKPTYNITEELRDYFKDPTLKIAYITRLDMIEAYESYDAVVYDPPQYEIDVHMCNMYVSNNVPISYKCGYMVKTINPLYFIICTKHYGDFPQYKNI